MMIPWKDAVIRWVAAVLVSLCYLSPAFASLGRKEPPAVDKQIPIAAASSPRASANDEFRIAPSTEVLLDGRPCRYEQVPDSAIIILLETVSNESNEIARIHFHSLRRPIRSSISK